MPPRPKPSECVKRSARSRPTEFEGVESEVLRKLADLRAAVAGEISDADGVEAVRAVLLRLFDRFIIHRGIPDKRVHVELIGEPWVEPIRARMPSRATGMTRGCDQSSAASRSTG